MLIDKYLPQEREYLASLWIELLHLSTHIERILAFHYRPRRPYLSLADLETDTANLRSLYDGLTAPNDRDCNVALLHFLHLQSYVNLVMIILHRPYMLETPEHLTAQQSYDLRCAARKIAKESAANLTAIASKLIALDLVDMSLNMLVATTMTAAQIHLFEIKTSEGLSHQFARNHFKLHVLILTQLQRTYWTASYQHQLFTETLKVMEEYEKGLRQIEDATVTTNPIATSVHGHETAPGVATSGQASTSTVYGTSTMQAEDAAVPPNGMTGLDELFLSFNPNPFLNLTMDADNE